MIPPRNAMSVPTRTGAYVSATAAERVKRGSTTISFAFLCCIASVTHLKPQGWASAALPPMIRTRSAFLISTQLLVIAPLPNVGPRLDTVGACHIRAWVSKATIPRPRATLTLRYPDSLEAALEARKPTVFQRFTVTPLSFFATKFLSRSAFMCFAIRSIASSQEMRFHSFVPGARTSGCLRRFGLWIMSSTPAPFGHSVPRFTGLSGSPSTWMIDGFTFFDLSPSVYISMPQLTEQYGQVLRLSVVRASLKPRTSAPAALGA